MQTSDEYCHKKYLKLTFSYQIAAVEAINLKSVNFIERRHRKNKIKKGKEKTNVIFLT